MAIFVCFLIDIKKIDISGLYWGWDGFSQKFHARISSPISTSVEVWEGQGDF
jgi:hypothetical protein